MEDTTFEPLSVMPVKRHDGRYTLRLCVNQGLITPEVLRRIMEVMDEFKLTGLRGTTGQRMNLEGVTEENLEAVIGRLGTAVKKCPPNIAACPGNHDCVKGQQETRELADELLAVVKKNGPYPLKIKAGVSGCSFGCALSFVRDIGFVGRKNGWDVFFGGSATKKAQEGILLGSQVSSEEALRLADKALVFYRENAKGFERTWRFVNRVSEEAVLTAVVE